MQYDELFVNKINNMMIFFISYLIIIKLFINLTIYRYILLMLISIIYVFLSLLAWFYHNSKVYLFLTKFKTSLHLNIQRSQIIIDLLCSLHSKTLIKLKLYKHSQFIEFIINIITTINRKYPKLIHFFILFIGYQAKNVLNNNLFSINLLNLIVFHQIYFFISL
jgi:hypothetical protein